jgi:hypothetical protein
MKPAAWRALVVVVLLSASVLADQPSYLTRRVGILCPTSTGVYLFGIYDPANTVAGWVTWQPYPNGYPISIAQVTTTNATGNANGFIGATALFGMARPSYQTALSAVFTSNWANRALRNWVAISSADLTATIPVVGPSPATAHFVGVVFDSLHGANHWICSGDGTNYSCVDTGVPGGPTYQDYFRVYLDWSTQTSLVTTLWHRDTVTGVWTQVYRGTKTTNLSASTTVSVGPTLSTTNLGTLSTGISTTGFAFYQTN